MLSVTVALIVNESPVVGVPDVLSVICGLALSMTVKDFSVVEFQLLDVSFAWNM